MPDLKKNKQIYMKGIARYLNQIVKAKKANYELSFNYIFKCWKTQNQHTLLKDFFLL